MVTKIGIDSVKANPLNGIAAVVTGLIPVGFELIKG